MPIEERGRSVTSAIESKVYGCLIGGAIGDALGAAVEGWTHQRIKEEYETFNEFQQYYMPYSNTEPGSITSDTALRQYLCLAVVENGGRIGPSELADVLLEHLNPDRVWVSEEVVLKKLSAGMDPWSAGRGGIPGNKATSAITPVGIVNAGNPTQAYQDGFTIASVFQADYHRHATATIAAGVAEAITPTATIDSVVTTIVEQSTGLISRAIDLVMGLAERAESADELVELLYEEFLDWRWPAVQWDRERYHRGKVFSASTIETVPVAIGLLSMCEGEVNQSIVEGVNYGRDSDAIATLIGSLTGALRGADQIRDEWKVTCEEANRDFFEELEGDPDANFRSMAGRLTSALKREREAAAEQADRLSRILSKSDTAE